MLRVVSLNGAPPIEFDVRANTRISLTTVPPGSLQCAAIRNA
jgi:hypothetical protein